MKLNMQFVYNIIKKIITSFLVINGFNYICGNILPFIPINTLNIIIIAILGMPGIISINLIYFLI